MFNKIKKGIKKMIDEAKAEMPTDEIMPAQEAVDTATEQVQDNTEAVINPAVVVENEEAVEATANSKVARVFDVTGREVREYSLEAHGIEFAVLAENFAKKIGGIVK